VKKDREIRAIGFDAAEFRFSDPQKRTLEGYAAVFESMYPLGSFDEVIMPGAFSRALEEGQDVRALIDHDPGRIIGRTKNKTLELREDGRGLLTRINLPDTQDARDLATLIEIGTLDAMSFGFTVTEDRWEKKEGRNTRYIEDVDLFDISIVAFPASPDSSVALRSMPDDLEDDDDIRRRRFNILIHNLRANTWGK
jgi:HK97 family phage prohead protease